VSVRTTVGLTRWLEHVPPKDGSGFLVWTALRKAQIDDQKGIPLIPLHGRGPQHCRKLPEVAVLAQKGYRVKDALCMRRGPFVDRCLYLRQFEQQGSSFAPLPLLKATACLWASSPSCRACSAPPCSAGPVPPPPPWA